MCPVHTLSTYFYWGKSANFELFILLTFFLAVLDFPKDQTRPDQTGLNQIRLDLCHIRTHTAFFKVKCINLVFTNYLLVYLQVPVLRGDSKSLFVSYMKPYRANHKAGSLLRVFPWMWWQSSSLSIWWDPQSGPAALTHSIVRSLCMDQVCRLYGPVVFWEGL